MQEMAHPSHRTNSRRTMQLLGLTSALLFISLFILQDWLKTNSLFNTWLLVCMACFLGFGLVGIGREHLGRCPGCRRLIHASFFSQTEGEPIRLPCPRCQVTWNIGIISRSGD
ncbi:hypothetical protein [Pseudomonas sp. BMS12]|uniref:hypothetical protein n=1 Tax=Pseudomonas sp. BMS12 TaxID=1796033 RepID=UPI00083B4747|nr:hypothetical protein [Pseudomonas sp. BMS12]